ncbi:myo-inosose-2 dehydratase [Labrys monachus]|uniref:Myo-inosose-2 dehydratase n=1 Tax=Labrys monachus TaxID=217067 RepID=A0ABU0FM89_9HYPH|nr:myo-inosose-2 dehydratase [Labrys monachus]MDQ0395208.1 myo-inosose-2 dehydratase [Labrys monachus]
MAIRIGANPIGWSNDDMLELGGETPLETCLAEARGVGFEGMELGNKFPREAEALKAALAPFGLACIGGWHSIELLERDAAAEFAAARAHIDLLKAMGTPVFIVAETSNAIHGDRSKALSQRPVLTSNQWTEYGRRLTTYAEALRAEGMQLVYHHHMGTIVQSEADIDALMAASGEAVNLLLDTGHATWGGADPAALARRYRHRIGHVHTKDVRAEVRKRSESGDWSFLDSVIEGVYTVPGDGMVDFAAVFRELGGYSGWVVVEAEQDPKKANPLHYAKIGYAHLRKVLAETGLI